MTTLRRVSSGLAFTLLLCLTPAASAAQDTPRPRIGLALSGGGARGIAHVGVLKWLEEHRIPIDYVAGTSMGGLAGGMYASGMTPEAMEELVRTTDWDAVLASSPPYPELSFRRKEDQRDYSSSIAFGLRGGSVRIPQGLNSGHAIGLILDRVMLPYAGLETFDDLPIPFRTLATDLVAGELEVFDGRSLSLTEALRATMALPGIFTPVARDGAIYADGGVLNNIPTDVVGQMGADIVIAVNVGSPLLTADQLDSLLDVLAQSVAVMGIQNDRRNLELADIVIAPDLEGHTVLDFTDPEGLIAAGYAAAAAHAGELGALALEEDAWQRHLEARSSRRREQMPVPRSIEVRGADTRVSGAFREALAGHVGAPLETARLERDLTRIVGNGRFASLGYRMTPASALRIDTLEKTHGPPFFDVGVDVDAATQGVLDLSVGGRLTAMDFGGAGAEWRSDLKLGIHDTAATEYFRPFDGSPWFLAPRAWWRARTEGLFENGDRIAELRTRQRGVGLDMGRTLGITGEIRAGYEIRATSSRIQTGANVTPPANGSFRSAFFRWVYDGHDRAVIPTRGVYAKLGVRWYSDTPGLVADLVQGELDVTALIPVSGRGSALLKLQGGDTWLRDPLPIQEFTLGGAGRLSAWSREEFRDRRFVVASAGYLRDLAALPQPFGDRLYAAGFVEAGRLYSGSNPTGLVGDAALALGTRSLLGAAWLGIAWGEGGAHQVFFRIGRLL